MGVASIQRELCSLLQILKKVVEPLANVWCNEVRDDARSDAFEYLEEDLHSYHLPSVTGVVAVTIVFYNNEDNLSIKMLFSMTRRNYFEIDIELHNCQPEDVGHCRKFARR